MSRCIVRPAPAEKPAMPMRVVSTFGSCLSCASAAFTLATSGRRDSAARIAAAVRHSSGGLRYVKAMGIPLSMLPEIRSSSEQYGEAHGTAVGGRPIASWPSYVPITFELTVLFAAITAVLGMLGLNGLPMPYHPVFNSSRFAFASKDRFFLIVFSSDPKYNPAEVRGFLQGLGPRSISEVPD